MSEEGLTLSLANSCIAWEKLISLQLSVCVVMFVAPTTGALLSVTQDLPARISSTAGSIAILLLTLIPIAP